MAEPLTLGAIITGLVGVYKAYTEYKAAIAQAEAKQTAAPAKSAEATKGEQVAPIIKTVVQQHGESEVQSTLALFENRPATFETALVEVLTQLAERNPTFAQQIRALAPQVPPNSTQSNINIGDQAQVDSVIGISTGTVTINAKHRTSSDKHDR